MFLESLQDIRLPKFRKKLDSIEYCSIDTLLAQCSSMQTTFTMAIQKFQPTFRSYADIVRLFEPLSALLSVQVGRCPKFSEVILSLEVSLSSSLLSLLTKPLARVPSYILVCKEIYATMMTIVSIVDEEYSEVLQYTQKLAKKLYAGMITTLAHCYSEAHTDQQKGILHDLHCQFTKGSSPINISGLVAVGRSVVRQGTLKRHLKLGRQGKVRLVSLHLLSDVLLGSSAVYEVKPPPPPKLKKSVSFENGILKNNVMETFDTIQQEYEATNDTKQAVEYDLVDNALHLDFCISLARRSGTVCLPLPSFFRDTESCWFVVIGSQKSVYICAESVADRDAWVRDLQEILVGNAADSDIFRVKNQRSLVNTLLSEINTRAGETLTAPSTSGQKPDNWAEICHENIQHIQLHWWGLYDVLEDVVRTATAEHGNEVGESRSELDSNPTSPISHLRHVIDLHTQELTETLLSLCPSATSRGQISAALEAGTANPSSEHLIAVDWFFQRSDAMNEKQTSETTPANSTRRWGGNSDTRPTVLLLFVMSNVLLAVKVVSNVSVERAQHFAVEYAFHIELKHLECVHHVWDCDFNQKASAKDAAVVQPTPSPVKSKSRSTSGSGSQSSAILLRDTSMSAMFKSLIGQNSVSERVIFAPNIETKNKWLDFLSGCITAFKSYDTGAADNTERTKLLHKVLPTLRRVSTKTAAGPCSGIWTTE
jgi:hypothetical protein